MKKIFESKWLPGVTVIMLAALFVTFSYMRATTATTTIGTNISTGGTLNVSGAAYASSTLMLDGASAFNGSNTFGNAAADINLFTGKLQASTTALFTSGLTSYGTITLSNGETIDNATDGYIQLSGIASTTSLTLLNGETITNANNGVITAGGNLFISGARVSNTSGYENFLEIEGDITTTAAGAKTYGISVDMTRTAVMTGGDLDDAGIKVRVRNQAINLVAGPSLRGLDVQAKNDDTGTGVITNVYGGLISTQTDSGSTASTSKALELNMTINGTVESELTGLDLRMFRQAATEPTTERAMRIRNGNTSGTGIDAGLVFESENDWTSNATTTFDYLIDANSSRVNTADIRLSNGETIGNLTDGYITLSGIASTTSLTLLNGETIDNIADGVISLTGIASTTSIRLANLETITNATNGTITLADDGSASISFIPATGAITPSTGMLYINASSTVMGYATTTAAGIIIPTARAAGAAPATCGALYEGGLAYDSTKGVLCICVTATWLQATTTGGATCF